jgi:hypothetical protein
MARLRKPRRTRRSWRAVPRKARITRSSWLSRARKSRRTAKRIEYGATLNTEGKQGYVKNLGRNHDGETNDCDAESGKWKKSDTGCRTRTEPTANERTGQTFPQSLRRTLGYGGGTMSICK